MILKKNKKETNLETTFFNNNFIALELIGEGSYGKVYKAKKEEFGVISYSAIKQIEIPKSEVEIKNLKSEGMTNFEITKYFEKSVSKWVEEINFMSAFKDSENIVKIEDYEILPKKNGVGFIINIRMELLTNLEAYIYEHNITDKEIIKMSIDVCKALEDCENHNIVHRDIKPENIFVNSKGVYKIGDFGVAKNIESSASNMSKRGTDNYMAPELYKNERGNKTVDIYSLGIMLYRFFNYNRLPFLPNYPNEITPDARENALYSRITGKKMDPPINASRDIAEIILKACNYYSKDRYQSAKDLKEDLEIIYKGIKKESILFNYDVKDMNKLYKENTKSESHNETISVFTGNKIINSNDLLKKEVINDDLDKLEKDNKINKEDDQNEIKLTSEEIFVAEEQAIVDEVKIENKEIVKENKINIDIKDKANKKEKNNKNKIIIGLILLLIILLTIFLILHNSRKEKKVYINVPNVIKLESNIASEMLTKEGLIIEYDYVETDNEEDINHILEQSIKANTKIEKGSLIKLKVAVSKEKVEVINVAGMTREEATLALSNIGLNVNITEQNSDDVEKDKVISQMTEVGTKVNIGTTIEILVSLGKEEIEEDKQVEKEEKKVNTNEIVKQKNWSNWVESLPSGVNSSNYNIETKKQYRSSTRTTKIVTEKDYRGDLDTEISDTNTAGWTVYDKKVEKVFGDVIWDQMSESQLNHFCSLDYYKLVSSERTYYAVQGTTCWNGENWKSSSNFTTPIIINGNVTCPDGYSTANVSNAKYVKVQSDSMPKIGSIVTGNYVVNGYNNFNISLYVTNAENGYTTHEQWLDYTLTTYYYEKWSDWSTWQDNSLQSDDNTKVEERTLYRYKEK